jgi:hypothetical protein
LSKSETLLRQGRKYGLGGCIATQRIAYLNTNALQQLQDPDKYRSYTRQHKIGKSLNKEPGSLIKYYKTGQQEDGYKGYSTNYQDLELCSVQSLLNISFGHEILCYVYHI